MLSTILRGWCGSRGWGGWSLIGKAWDALVFIKSFSPKGRLWSWGKSVKNVITFKILAEIIKQSSTDD